ncbi:Rok-like winged helix domain-containing protein [Desmospora profundinema]|uniref:Nucleic acid-binding protein n=1 Tax=Desmospora profundinema TaxID=1571184 RepID=A0ABU1IK62_9BACL|nr:hypothetical protein [Desmospora profundinema]MDR6225148.1 putative nucleic acid-binding protein [Desmospora profundinema]
MSLEKELAELIRRVVREENAALLEDLRKELNPHNQLNHLRKVVPKKVVKEERRYEDEPSEMISSRGAPHFVEQEILLDFSQTKGVRKNTIETAEIVARCLQKHGGPLRLNQIQDELKKHGKDMGSNVTTRMQAIMKICPAIKKIGRGLYTYQP